MEIKREVNDLLHSQFELPYDKLLPEANLYQDLELDSLDAADLLVLLEARSGVTIMPESLMGVHTLDDLYRLATSLLGPTQSECEVDGEVSVRLQPTTPESAAPGSG